jgi:hypothetical protein
VPILRLWDSVVEAVVVVHQDRGEVMLRVRRRAVAGIAKKGKKGDSRRSEQMIGTAGRNHGNREKNEGMIGGGTVREIGDMRGVGMKSGIDAVRRGLNGITMVGRGTIRGARGRSVIRIGIMIGIGGENDREVEVGVQGEKSQRRRKEMIDDIGTTDGRTVEYALFL